MRNTTKKKGGNSVPNRLHRLHLIASRTFLPKMACIRWSRKRGGTRENDSVAFDAVDGAEFAVDNRNQFHGNFRTSTFAVRCRNTQSACNAWGYAIFVISAHFQENLANILQKVPDTIVSHLQKAFCHNRTLENEPN